MTFLKKNCYLEDYKRDLTEKMRITRFFFPLLKWLKSFFKTKVEEPKPINFQHFEEKLLKSQDTISGLQNSIGIIAKISSSQLSKQTKNEEIHAGILDVLTQHEQELDNFKALLNQHADVINTLRKHVYKDILLEETKKDVDENPELTNILEVKKKINKAN